MIERTVRDQVMAECHGNTPEAICKLLRAVAGGTMAKTHGHDTILIGAAEMIEAFERRAVDLRCEMCKSDD